MGHDWMRFCFKGKLDEDAVLSKIENKGLFDNEDGAGGFIAESFHLTQLSKNTFPNRKEADAYFAQETKWDGDNEGWVYYYTKKDGSVVTVVETVSEHY